jgi:predicted Zn-dependent protease
VLVGFLNKEDSKLKNPATLKFSSGVNGDRDFRTGMESYKHNNPTTPKTQKRWLTFLGLTLLAGAIVILAHSQLFAVAAKPIQNSTPNLATSPAFFLPVAKPHPLPPTLAQWQDPTHSGDYFSQVEKTEVGYLVWSQFPIRVYVETPKAIAPEAAQAWVSTVLKAVQQWSIYLPIKVVETSQLADIIILQKVPPLQISPDNKIPRARSALTTYVLYATDNTLRHRFTILLHPGQTGKYLLAAARHELGHALGIWGHSPLKSDALYFSQVTNPPPISPRDVNTLKRVYEQSTSLGWTLPK